MALEPREHIEHIRATTFSIGQDGDPSPHTLDLLRASTALLNDLSNIDFDFLYELFHNAENNEYPAEEYPSLAFALTTHDLTQTGAPETLLVFSNEVGFSAQDVEAICSVGQFKKRGKQRGGISGQRGIGFKSVFTISKQPYIVSNGYRIRFNEEPDQDCGIRFIVPEWVYIKPSFSDIQREYGSDKILPTTVILLPLKPEKVEFVRRKLFEINPEILLFSKLKQLSVRQNKNPLFSIGAVSSLLITNEPGPISNDEKNSCWCISRLSVWCIQVYQPSKYFKCDYYIWKERFPVNFMGKVDEKGDIEVVDITIVFPVGERLGQVFSAFSSFPTTFVTDLPYIFQSDFLITPSREIILENTWNMGLLDCIPSAFVNAFLSCLKSKERVPWFSPAQPYEFLPAQDYRLGITREPIAMKAINESIRKQVKELCVVACESFSGEEEVVYARPSDVRRLLPLFRKLLNKMKQQGMYPKGIQSDGNFVLHSSLDSVRYFEALKFLGVEDTVVDPAWYGKCIQNCNLLSEASEEVYVDLLCVFAEYWDTFRRTDFVADPFLKYVEMDKVRLCRIHEIRSNEFKLYYSIDSREHAWLNKWWSSFGCQSNMFLLPDLTQEALLNHQRKYFLSAWLQLEASVSSTTVRDYSIQLVEFLSKNSNLDALIYLPYFLHESLLNKFISEVEVCLICRMMPIIDGGGHVHIERNKTLVPAHGSKWEKLFGSNPYSEEKYVDIGKVYEEIPASTNFLSCLLKYTNAVDLLELNPPNLSLPVLSSGLTAEQALLLLDWLHVLRRRGIEFPSNFMGSIRNGKWLKTVSGFSSPSQCLLLDEAEKSTCKKEDKVIISTAIIDELYYEDKISFYKDELKAIGVRFVL